MAQLKSRSFDSRHTGSFNYVLTQKEIGVDTDLFSYMANFLCDEVFSNFRTLISATGVSLAKKSFLSKSKKEMFATDRGAAGTF